MRVNQSRWKLVPVLFSILWSALPASAQNVGVGAIAGNDLINESTVTNWLQTLGSTYHRASTIQAGRMIKAGFNFEF